MYDRKKFRSAQNVTDVSFFVVIVGFEFPIPTVNKKYEILIVRDMNIPVEVT